MSRRDVRIPPLDDDEAAEAHEMFTTFDNCFGDGDGVLSMEEVFHMSDDDKRALQRFDVNNDACIDRSEWLAFLAVKKHELAEHREGFVGYLRILKRKVRECEQVRKIASGLDIASSEFRSYMDSTGGTTMELPMLQIPRADKEFTIDAVDMAMLLFKADVPLALSCADFSLAADEAIEERLFGDIAEEAKRLLNILIEDHFKAAVGAALITKHHPEAKRSENMYVGTLPHGDRHNALFDGTLPSGWTTSTDQGGKLLYVPIREGTNYPMSWMAQYEHPDEATAKPRRAVGTSLSAIHEYRIVKRGLRSEVLQTRPVAVLAPRMMVAQLEAAEKEEEAATEEVEMRKEIMCCRMLGKVNGRTDFSPSSGMRFDVNGLLAL